MLTTIETLLTGACAVFIILCIAFFYNPRWFQAEVPVKDPLQLIIKEVKPLLGCNERIKRYIMSAGELREQDFNPEVSIMFCGG